MAVVTTVVLDDAEKTVYEERDDDAGYVGTRTVWKAGTPQSNYDALVAKAQNAIQANNAYLASAQPTFATLAQGQAAVRTLDQQVRVLTRENQALIKLVWYLLGQNGMLDDLNGT